ncbi:Phosphatidate phosphatase [Lachnellula willkommii]|uniref:Phosphatidate phosphatase n=1 Tax=Lachnellula willkommii TaxID=215461 RepID=A0A559MEC1_9HELO|nr:Phosphatidate phosphatase [Lachnellula willkommii]
MSDSERKTRQERNFHDTESSWPNIRADPASDKRATLTNDLLSHLGQWNPFPQQITANDTLWLLDNTAYRSPKTNEWQAEFVAAVFDQNSGVEISTVVADVAAKLGIAKGDAAEATIQERLMPFVQTILPGRVVNAEFAQKETLKLGPGGRNAISSDIKSIPGFDSGSVVSTVARVPEGANGILEGKTFFAEPEGWGLISGEDIDDTIKITQTSNPIGILRSTFVSEATPIQGMPELYTYIQSLISKTSPFFYLSASPYNLYYFLSQFRQKFYPQGTMILRDASWMNLSGFLSSFTLGTQEYKVDRMVKINSWVPRRKMICIGDSTQSDPEAYGEIFRKFPCWVHLILIRKVTDIAAIGIEEKNEPKRFEKAFDGVPNSVWHVFESPEECYKILSDVTGNKS